MDTSWARLNSLIVMAAYLCALPLRAQEPVTIHVALARTGKGAPRAKAASGESSDVAAWLTPLDPQAPALPAPAPSATILQEGKTFIPHVTVVRIGTAVDFPNRDPFFHNVFSLYNGVRFDLGLYESGTSKTIRFTRPGVSYLFCNIHENMTAVVIAVDTRYFGVSDRGGNIVIAGVPDGRYTMHVFYERSTAEALKRLERQVTISSSVRSITDVTVPVSPDVTLVHKNKYGGDYVPPPASGYGP